MNGGSQVVAVIVARGWGRALQSALRVTRFGARSPILVQRGQRPLGSRRSCRLSNVEPRHDISPYNYLKMRNNADRRLCRSPLSLYV